MKHENCTGEVKERHSGLLKICYCEECGLFEILENPCDHNYRPVSFKVGGGVDQIRKYCTLCYEITSSSEKKSNYEGIKLPVWNLSEYREN